MHRTQRRGQRAEIRECHEKATEINAGREKVAKINAPNSAVHCRPDSAVGSAKCSKHSASGKSEATAEQQRVDSPRH